MLTESISLMAIIFFKGLMLQTLVAQEKQERWNK
ncbi:hypothetical protein BAPNAU_2979 [Bacillus velezensis NAU-B3]|nr:hypothetical protein BAPNAU_2979 [Bacillus velezensis NAU-B3]